MPPADVSGIRQRTPCLELRCFACVKGSMVGHSGEVFEALPLGVPRDTERASNSSSNHHGRGSTSVRDGRLYGLGSDAAA
jgi:hypothetical protein